MKKSKYLVGIAGNIGVGKTTLTKNLAECFKWKACYESVISNPYLEDFYRDMKRWSFNLQIYFLAHRFKVQKEMIDSNHSSIQDRTIYEDVEIFARSLYEQGHISARDYQTYRQLFYDMEYFLPKPDLIIYLRASVSTLLNRINRRGREYEKRISPDYIEYLNHAYEKWIKEARESENILIINADEVDLFGKMTNLKN
jgi:deoxyadenosine/deoxycytidine kinase